MHIIDGRKVAIEITKRIRERLSELEEPLSFQCVLVGDDPASELYVRRKEKMARDLGVLFTLHRLPEDASVEDVIKKTEELNKSKHGYIIQLPLPLALRAQTNNLLQHIDPTKDADGLTEINRKRFIENSADAFLPTPVAAVMALIHSLGKEDYTYLPFNKKISSGSLPDQLQNGRAVIVSNGVVFGQTLTVALERVGMHASVIQSRDLTKNQELLEADLVVTAIGRPGIITGGMIRSGATLIDVGTTLQRGHTLGDLDWESISTKAYAATPVPGGVGPVTVAMLYANLLNLALR